MDELKQIILNEWLHIDFYHISKKLKFIDKDYQVTEKLIVDTIRCLDYVTTFEKTNANYVVTIIALMWTHIDKTQYDIKNIVIKFLSRIGYPTSSIIADSGYDKSTNTFSEINSPIDKLTIALNQSNNEIYINGHSFLLTVFQKQIWVSMDYNKVIGISAPTSAGKSFVILLKLAEQLFYNKLDIIYIIPTLSLLTQVTEDFNKMLKLLNVPNYLISNTYAENDDQEKSHIYVMTQEKAIAALSSDENAFCNNLILVADEIQNIERIENHEDERAKILFDVLTEFRYKKNVEQIIISGPRIQKLEEVGKSIFGIETDEIITDVSPVLNLTYSIKEQEGCFYFKQYCALTDTAITEIIEDSSTVVGYGNNTYDEAYYGFLKNMIDCFNKDDQNIVFAPTPSVARRVACNINSDNSVAETKELIDYYSNTVRNNYALCKSLEYGIAYHHGKLPMHVRSTLEKAISEKLIRTVVCTTTLMQGVNMPAQNIIIRNPHLYLKRHSSTAELSNYEMANLRGRAGRLLKDFIGRTFVLDESSFEEIDGYDQVNLFDDVDKELPANYGEKFQENESDILDAINSGKIVDGTMSRYGYLVSYIRQSVLKYREDSIEKMNNVGIALSKEQVAAIIYKMDQLTVPKDICYKNRYWDPLVLEDIYCNFSENVPSHPKEYGARAKLDRMLKFLRDNDATSNMYNKHIPAQLRRSSGRGILIDLCMKWSKETSLFQILSDSKYEDPDKIEDTIEVLQNTVSFHVPLLLKPIFDIKNPESCFLTCMQCGANNIATRKLIELGISRETAIFLNQNLFNDFDESKEYSEQEIDTIIRETLKSNINSLPYWIKTQFEYLI